MPEQELHGSEVAGSPVDEHCLRTAQRVRTELRRIEPNSRYVRKALSHRFRTIVPTDIHPAGRRSVIRQRRVATQLGGQEQQMPSKYAR